jgi:hypothetical protein
MKRNVNVLIVAAWVIIASACVAVVHVYRQQCDLAGVAAITRQADGSEGIALNKDAVSDPHDQAIVLSHMIVHLMHHDPSTEDSSHTLVRHAFWMTEENEAIQHGLKTSKALGMSPPLGALASDYLTLVYPLPILFALMLGCVVVIAKRTAAKETL